MKILVVSWNDVADMTIQDCINKAGFSEEVRDEDIEDNPFSASKQRLDVLQIPDDQLIQEKIGLPAFLLWMTVWLQLIQEIREVERANENEEDDHLPEQVTNPEI